MTLGWATGLGPSNYDFGPGSVEVKDMMLSPGVQRARDYYRKSGCDSSGNPRTVSGGHPFGLKGLWDSGLNPIEQFVGSYDWTISPNADGTITITLKNTTSVQSLLYDHGPRWDRGKSIPTPGGNVTQTFHWTEPNPSRAAGGCGCQ